MSLKSPHKKDPAYSRLSNAYQAASNGGNPQFFGTNRSGRIPDGEISSFTAGFAFLGGMSIEYGTVTDRQGGKIRFEAINGNLGFGLGAGYHTKGIYVTANDPDGVFTVDNFLNSYTHEIEGGIAIFDFSKGWQANDNYMSPAEPSFLIGGGGVTIGLNFGAWWTRSIKTTQW